MGTFFKGLADFMGETGASYHAYWDRENAKARAAAKIQRQIQVQQAAASAYEQFYVPIAELLYDAILNSADATHISRPRNVAALFSTPPIGLSKWGFFIFLYNGIYDRKTLDSYGITARVLDGILNDALDHMVILRAFPYRLKVHVELAAYGKIIFKVVFLQDALNAMRRGTT